MLYYAAQVSPLNIKGVPESYTDGEAIASLRQAYERPPPAWGLRI